LRQNSDVAGYWLAWLMVSSRHALVPKIAKILTMVVFDALANFKINNTFSQI
jgi:hypothetical protein